MYRTKWNRKVSCFWETKENRRFILKQRAYLAISWVRWQRMPSDGNFNKVGSNNIHVQIMGCYGKICFWGIKDTSIINTDSSLVDLSWFQPIRIYESSDYGAIFQVGKQEIQTLNKWGNKLKINKKKSRKKNRACWYNTIS